VSAITLDPIDLRHIRWHRAIGTVAIQRFWWCFTGVLALMAGNGFWRLGDTFVRDLDEGRYGVAASEMLHRHSLLVTTYAGATEFWNLKPPLGYWLLGLSYHVVGETAFGLRLPAAVCALLPTALTMLMARRVAGARAALLAGLFLATSFGFLGHHGARSGELDVPLALLMLLFLMLAPRLADDRAARLAAGLVLALGFLLKSFAILPYVAAVALYGLITRGVGSWRLWPLPLGITTIAALTWAVARSVAEDSWEFVRRMFVEDLLLRSTTMIDPGGNSAWDYVGALFDRLAPWTFVVVLALCLSRYFARRRLSSDFATLTWCYALVPPALFTLARTHHSWYIIPIYPVWALLAAVATLEVLECAERVEFAAPAATLVVVCALACEIRMVVQIAIHDRMPQSQVFLASLRDRSPTTARSLRVTFTPSYSERFFLQVVDGFTLIDSSDRRSSEADTDDAMLLMRKATIGSTGIANTIGVAVLAQNAHYVLVRSFPPATVGAVESSRAVPQ
jgi:4-amino-4-deoxy-L-arabinose transferase-like glycosyltransferase